MPSLYDEAQQQAPAPTRPQQTQQTQQTQQATPLQPGQRVGEVGSNEPAANDSGGESIAPEKVAEMQQALAAKVPPNLKGPYDKLVEAGKTVMYSPGSEDLVMAEIKRDKPIDQKLAHAAMGLMHSLGEKAKGTMPPDAAVLAGACLLLEMVDLVTQVGISVSQQDVRDALDTFVTLNMMKAGAKEPEIMQALGAKGGAPTPDTPPVGGAPL